MERLTFERSRAKNVGLILMGMALVAASWLTIQKADDSVGRVFGWFGVVFFGFAIVVGVRHVLQGGVAFVLDQIGITTEGDDIELIPWFAVESCSVVSIQGTRLLSITFWDPEEFLSRVSASKRKLATFNHSMGWGHWSLSFVGVRPGIDEALHFIQKNAPTVRVSSAG